VYLDDRLIYSDTLKELPKESSNILKAIRDIEYEGQTIQMGIPPKRNRIPRLYHGQEGVKTDLVRTQAIWDRKTRKNKKKILSLQRCCNFYRRFIEGFSRTAKPLYARTTKVCIDNLEWRDKQPQTFHKLRTQLTTVPGVVYINFYALVNIEIGTSKHVY